MNEKVTEPSFRRFLKVALSIGEPKYYFHQTLTCPHKYYSPEAVKGALNRLLDLVHKRYDVFSLYVLENQEEDGLHAHLLCSFYGDAFPYPNAWRERFGTEVYKIWKRLHGGKTVRRANKTKEYEAPDIDIRYLVGDTKILNRNVKHDREKIRWWGSRNNALIQQYGVPLDQKYLEWVIDEQKEGRNPYRNKSQRRSKRKNVNPFPWKPDPLIEDDCSQHTDAADFENPPLDELSLLPSLIIS